MYVPNYIPSPIEIPRNVTEERYRVRVGFIRRVSVFHFLSLLLIFGLSLFALPAPPLTSCLLALAVQLLALSMVRILTRATKLDQALSLIILPFLILLLALTVRILDSSDWPIWGVAVGAACSVIYALACNRDFSYVGQFFLSLVVSTVALAIVATTIGFTPRQGAFLLGTNAVYLFYLVYDSASLLARRRLGEEAVAVVDLYRDVFNFFGYVARVARHWRKHRIWVR